MVCPQECLSWTVGSVMVKEYGHGSFNYTKMFWGKNENDWFRQITIQIVEEVGLRN